MRGKYVVNKANTKINSAVFILRCAAKNVTSAAKVPYKPRLLTKIICVAAIIGAGIVVFAVPAFAAAPNNNVQRYTIVINPNPTIPPETSVQRYNIQIAAEPTISISLSTNASDPSSELFINADYDKETSGWTRVTVITNAINGYEVNMRTQSGNTGLTCLTDNTAVVPSVAVTTPASGLPTNSWGFNVSAGTASVQLAGCLYRIILRRQL